jgi:hypothetical protein
MSGQNTIMNAGFVPGSTFQLFQPMNLLVFLSFFSPIILATSITGMSFIFQNFKGLIYLGLLIFCCVFRSFAYMMVGANPIINDGTICSTIQYSKYGNPTFSAFVFAFTIMYLSFPMFTNNSVNYWIFISLITYFFVDMFVKIYNKCVVQLGDLFLNVLVGAMSSALIVYTMYAAGFGKYLFFNEMSTSKEMCYQPSKQNFKCSLYSNGELVSEL